MGNSRKIKYQLSVNNTISAILATFLTFLCSLTYAASLEEWYQVDLIIFKPNKTTLDDEAWPKFEPSYPFNVVAITEPRVFNLSQLEGLDYIPGLEAEEALDATLGRDEFLFEFEGNNQRNRRLLESLAVSKVSANEEVIENHQELENIKKPADLIDSEEIQVSVTEIIESPQPQLDIQNASRSFSAGTLAYMRTLENSSLKSILKNLNWSSRFKVLSHDSWVQPIGSEPIPILMQTGERYDNRFEVEGTLSFNRNRFLHIQTNLWYNRFEPRTKSISDARQEEVTSELSDEMLIRYKDLVAIENQRGQYFVAATHRMIQSRRMRSSELHYLDHPLFGVIVRINRYDPEQETKRPP